MPSIMRIVVVILGIFGNMVKSSGEAARKVQGSWMQEPRKPKWTTVENQGCLHNDGVRH